MGVVSAFSRARSILPGLDPSLGSMAATSRRPTAAAEEAAEVHHQKALLLGHDGHGPGYGRPVVDHPRGAAGVSGWPLGDDCGGAPLPASARARGPPPRPATPRCVPSRRHDQDGVSAIAPAVTAPTVSAARRRALGRPPPRRHGAQRHEAGRDPGGEAVEEMGGPAQYYLDTERSDDGPRRGPRWSPPRPAPPGGRPAPAPPRDVLGPRETQ